MTPDDPSKTIDEDLIKRLQALRECGPQYVRSTSSKSYASSTDSAESIYEENFEELLSDDALVDDVILEEQEGLGNDGEECIHCDLGTVSTKEAEMVDDEIIRDSSSPLDNDNAQNAEESEVYSTERTCQGQKTDCIDETNSQCEDVDENGDIDNVVDNMRAELKEAMDEGERLEHELEDQIKQDIAIGQGDDRTLLEANQDEIDRRSSADSGVQEDRTDGDESSETQSAISPVTEVAKPEVSGELVRETTEVECEDEEDGTSNVNAEGKYTVIVDSTEGEETVDVDSAERTVKYSCLENNNGDTTLDQNANENEAVAKDLSCEDVTKEILQEEKTEDGDETDERTAELELTDGESKGDIDGALDETEEERIARLQEEALARHLKTISKDVLTYMGKYLAWTCFIIKYCFRNFNTDLIFIAKLLFTTYLSIGITSIPQSCKMQYLVEEIEVWMWHLYS